MAIDRSFTVAGHGTVVTGTVASGSVTVGDELEWQPAGRIVRVRGLHRHDRPVERIGRGSRAAINLVGVHHAEIRRGQELAAPGYLQATSILSVEVAGSAEAVRPLRHRGRYKLHLGTAEVSAVLSLLETNEASPGDASARPALRRRAGGRGSRPAVRAPRREPAGDPGGRPRPSAIGHAAFGAATIGSIARLGRLRSADPVERLRAALAFLGLTSWTEPPTRRADRPGRRRGRISPGDADGVRRPGRAAGRAAGERSASWRSMPPISRSGPCAPWAGCTRRVRGMSAIPRAQLAAAFPDLANEALAAGLIDRLKAQGKVVADSRTVALRRLSAQAEPGRTETQERAGRDDPRGRA